ncbi:hypothetical protein [Promineifilum sp.]|uniref:hypothetical protein n=1 Tax=Promineifilum sp. TaxID=2664178 RepID=UPI0035B3B4A8
MIKGTNGSLEFNMAGREAVSRKTIIAVILGVALIAFEIFNFDTTQFALKNLLGEVSFAKVMWATILAIAFCAIDFAGLVRIFTPQRGMEEPRAVWFLTGAWFLGTIANSIMTWWAVSLTLLSHDFGNEVLSREMLLRYVPIFVAMLVWLTRILFIGAFSITGEDLFEMNRKPAAAPARPERPAAQPAAPAMTAAKPAAAPRAAARQEPAHRSPTPHPKPSQPAVASQPLSYEPVDEPVNSQPPAPKTNGNGAARPTSRINRQPPMPGRPNVPVPGKMHAGPTDNRRQGPLN